VVLESYRGMVPRTQERLLAREFIYIDSIMESGRKQKK